MVRRGGGLAVLGKCETEGWTDPVEGRQGEMGIYLARPNCAGADPIETALKQSPALFRAGKGARYLSVQKALYTPPRRYGIRTLTFSASRK